MNEEKHLDATPARIARARTEGNVPRSSELIAACAFGASAIVACAAATPFATLARAAMLAAARGAPPYREVAALLALAMLPATGGAIAAIVVNAAQSGGVRVTGLGFKAERLDPAEGMRRMLSRETAAHVARAAAAFGVAVAALVPAIEQTIVLAALAKDRNAVAGATSVAVRKIFFVACAVGLGFALAEYRLLRGAWLRKLRMSFDELKREVKEHEGDPHVRGRRRGLRRELLRGSLQAVREAAFVVANPAHVAIALAYRPPETPVPRVLVRAAESAAVRVREIAARCGIPVIENAALARALFRDARPGLPIPVEHYVAVAEIVVALARRGALAS